MSSVDSTGPGNVCFAEDHGSGRKATYYELGAGYRVDVTYDHGTLRPTPYHAFREDTPPFASRDQVLKQELLSRKVWYKAHTWIPGYEEAKFIGKESDPEQLAFINYSAKPARNFSAQVVPTTPFARDLGMEDFGREHRKLRFRSTWHHNGLPSYQFREDGVIKTLRDTVIASNDQTAYKISMMRHVDSEHDGKSVVYTGRPDTVHKAIEQIQFIFRSEMAKPPEQRQGIRQLPDSSFELTYMVNNLMSSMTVLDVSVTGMGSEFDETISILREKAILEALGPLVIDGKKVHINPLYFNQGVNLLNDFGIPSIQKEINEEGYQKLFELAESRMEDNPLVQTAIAHLKDAENLLPEEEFFYRDLLCKLLGIPEVDHCKSSTDRTILMVAISMATKEWMNLGLPIPRPTHALLQDARFKELIFSNMLSGHQVTRISRSAEGTVAEAKQFSQIIGFEWGSIGLNKNYVALRLLPERFTEECDSRPPQISVALKILNFVNKFFCSDGIAQKISYLERAYIKREFKPDLFLTKPKGMKIYYPKGSANPHNLEKKKPSRFKQFKEGAARFGMTVHGFFSTLATISSILISEQLERRSYQRPEDEFPLLDG